MSATFDNISPHHSPITPRSSDGLHRHEVHTTRRLSQAIDALRRECEAILWELNSLKTQNSSLEQRILDQANELDDINRSLHALREQHMLIEDQYREKLRALRSELHSLREERSSTAASTSVRARQSPSPPDWPRIASDQRLSQRHTPQSIAGNALSMPVPVVPPGLRAHTRNLGRDRGTDAARASAPRVRSAHLSQPPSTPLPSPRHASSYISTTQAQHPLRPQPRRAHSGHQRTDQSHPPSPCDLSYNSPQHDPSLSPTATLIGSDAPSRPRSRKG